jgi:hypothetical protein
MKVDWKNRRGCIVSMHKKQEVIAPLLSSELGIICTPLEAVDTDALGTFSGEVERKGSPLEALRAKCQLAIDCGWDDIVIASEGSFGPHPQMYFAYADDEWVMLKDVKHNLEILGRHVSSHTNFNAKEVSDWKALQLFAEQVKFPSHALILRPAVDVYSEMQKGISTWEKLEEVFHSLKETFGSVYVETDMRAHFNPSRMAVIQRATEDLVRMLKSVCPSCNAPGYGVVEVFPGLPCESCGMPTASTLKHLYRCQHCSHSSEHLYPRGKKKESPMYCSFCNP